MKKSKEESVLNLTGMTSDYMLIEQGIVPDGYNFYTETNKEEKAQACITETVGLYNQALGGENVAEELKKEIRDMVDISDFTDEEKEIFHNDPLMQYEIAMMLDEDYDGGEYVKNKETD